MRPKRSVILFLWAIAGHRHRENYRRHRHSGIRNFNPVPDKKIFNWIGLDPSRLFDKHSASYNSLPHVLPKSMFMSMPHVHVRDACPCFCLMSISVQNRILACSMDTDSVDMDTQHRQGHVAWIWACRMDMDTQQHVSDMQLGQNIPHAHVLVHALCQCLLHVHVHATFWHSNG
jgi:hypothetical protein